MSGKDGTRVDAQRGRYNLRSKKRNEQASAVASRVSLSPARDEVNDYSFQLFQNYAKHIFRRPIWQCLYKHQNFHRGNCLVASMVVTPLFLYRGYGGRSTLLYGYKVLSQTFLLSIVDATSTAWRYTCTCRHLST